MKSIIISLLLSVSAIAQVWNGNGSGGLVRSVEVGDFTNTLSVSAANQIPVGGTTTTSTANQRVFNTVVSGTVSTNLQLASTITGTTPLGIGVKTLSWSSSNPTVATINTGGYVTQVGTVGGTVKFFCTTSAPPNIASLSYTFAPVMTATATVFSGWQVTTPVSLPAHLNAQVDGLIASSGSAALPGSMLIYSATNDSTGVYTRNTGIWTGTVNLTGIAVWDSYDSTMGAGGSGGGTLITPTDIITANHFLIPKGNTIRFVDNSNNTFTATIAGTQSVGSTDICVEHLAWSGTTPSSLAIEPVLPSTYATYWPDHVPNCFPVICTNQFRQIFVQDSTQNSTATTTAFSGGSFSHNTASEATRFPWTLPIVLYDSGSPIMCLINGQLVLVCCNYSSGAGPSCADNISGINSTLSALGSSYTVTTPNMTTPIAFPTY